MTQDHPDFRCEKGHPLGCKRETEDGPWLPTPCHLCGRKVAEKAAAERRKRGPTVAGIDVRKVLAAYRTREPFVGRLGRHIQLQVRHSAEHPWSGHAATYRRRIVLTFGPGITAADVLELTVHEMCHLACPPHEAHGERFKRTLRRAAFELWGIEVPYLKGSERGDEENSAYAMDRIILETLNTKLAAGELDLLLSSFAPDVSVAKKVERRDIVEKRAAHVRTMLARAERRAKSAQQVLTKWRKKARYYEQVAAKRGGG